MGTLARAGFTVALTGIVALEAVALAGWQGWFQAGTKAALQAATQVQVQVQAAEKSVETAVGNAMHNAMEKAVAVIPQRPEAVTAPVLVPKAEDSYYAELRRKLRWVPTRFANSSLQTPDLESRMLLAKSAAERAKLHEVGLGARDVYGIINAETSWVPRLGASKNGTPNLGIAQFEPATARALGMRNPNDPVEAVHVAALHMKEAARWSQDRIAGLPLTHLERGIKLREGVSIYYNLSTKGRNTWNGKNTRKLPRETQLHIYNARIGAMQADHLEQQLRASDYAGMRARTTVVANVASTRS
jgi:hypothetical protein